MKPQWHWIKDNDFPKDGQDVWCLLPSCATGYYGESLMYVKDLYKFDKMDFAEYKGKHQGGFVELDSEWGWQVYNEVVVWCELPEWPDELKEEK